MGLLQDMMSRTRAMKVPVMKSAVVQVLLGVINCIFFGCGVIIAGLVNNSLPDVAIGLLQLFVPILGWIWAVVWGIIMITKYKQAKSGYEIF